MDEIQVIVICPHCEAECFVSMSVSNLAGVGSGEFYFLPAVCRLCTEPILLYWPGENLDYYVVLSLDPEIMSSNYSTPDEKMAHIVEAIDNYQNDEENAVPYEDSSLAYFEAEGEEGEEELFFLTNSQSPLSPITQDEFDRFVSDLELIDDRLRIEDI